MKGYSGWSYAPYRPPLTQVGDIYICRIAPGLDSIHFEWLDISEECSVFFRRRDEGEFLCLGKTCGNEFDVENLETDTDYEFYVAAGEKKSRVRLARTAQTIGIVVNYLHPDDEAYAFSGRYLCSPSFVRHPDGYLLASMDVFNHKDSQNLTLIFRSDDDGATWHYVSELMPCFWGKMFIHKGELYMLSCSTEYGDLLIGKSTDGGKTFCAPVCLLRGSNGKNGHDGVHKNPQNIMRHNGRIYETLEWGAWANEEFCHAAMVMSCDENDDLLIPENWSFTEPKKFDPHDAPELSELPERTTTIEGTLVISPEGKLLNIMRFGRNGYAICYEVDQKDPEAQLKYYCCMRFDAHLSKFMIKYDAISGKYFTIADYIYDYSRRYARNLVCLMVSDDLQEWNVVSKLVDKREEDWQYAGIQYVDFEFEGDDILCLCRTALNQPHNYHDANYSTFHRLENFRDLVSK